MSHLSLLAETPSMVVESAARITDPSALLAFFAAFVAVVFLAARTKPFDQLFRYIPPVVWIYLLPAVGTTLKLTPRVSPLYEWCSQTLLPASLLLLTLSVDLKAIGRLGRPAVIMLLSGTCGIVVGGPIALALFQADLDPQTWKGLGALAGSWIGGGENMLAIKEGVNCPEPIFSPIIVVDSVVGYGWMTLMISFSRHQDRVDRFNRANREVLDELNHKLADYQAKHSRSISLPTFAIMLGVGLGGGWLAMQIGKACPEVGAVMSEYTWGILVVLAIGVGLSFTPARKLENEGASAIAYGGLYLLVATMGAGGDLREVAKAPLLFLVGTVWIGVHIIFLTVAARLIRAPMFLFATGSMGNIGGVITTPVIAGVYQPALAPVGVLMGVLGNLVGTPAGLLCAQLMSWVAAAHFGNAAAGIG